MSSLRQVLWLAGALALPATGLMAFKINEYGFPVIPRQTAAIWDLEIYFDFRTFGLPAKIEAFIPSSNKTGRIIEEEFFSGEFGLTIERNQERPTNRRVVWSARTPSGRQILRYRALVVPHDTAEPPPEHWLIDRSEGERVSIAEVAGRARQNWYRTLRQKSSDPRSYTAIVLQEISASRLDRDLRSLLPPNPTEVDRLKAAQQALTANGIAATVVRGLYVDHDRRRAELKAWLIYRLYNDLRYYFLDFTPEQVIPIWTGTERGMLDFGVSSMDQQYALTARARQALDVATERLAASSLPFIDLTALPITTQLVYRILLTIPVGILVLVILRQIVGLDTLGTFMPVLIGISFRETALLIGILLFSGLVLAGLMLRLYFERLQLLLVPRLASVLIFIVIAMTAVTVATNSEQYPLGLSVALFPMVIITMTIERMSVVWEEYSAGDALRAGIGSLIVASICYLVMSNAHVEHWMFAFPETLLLLLAITLLLGRYTGLRLLELWRFRHLALPRRSSDD